MFWRKTPDNDLFKNFPRLPDQRQRAPTTQSQGCRRMIGLLFMVGSAVWMLVALFLAIGLPSFLGIKRFTWLISALLFPVLVVLPVADRWIGRWQFEKLCEQNVMHLSPDWQNVKRAKIIRPHKYERLSWYATRIERTEFEYKDIHSGKIFLHYNAYYNYGGFLTDNLGLALSSAPRTCWPRDYDQIWEKINLQQLLDQGKIND